MQFKVNYFLGTCCCTRTHTTYRHTRNALKFNWKFGNFCDLQFCFRRARRTKTSKQNRERGRRRTNTERASAANFVVRAPKLNWLQTQAASIRFTQAARMLHSIDCHSSRTSRLALQSNRRCESEHVAANSCRFVRFVCFGFQFVSDSVRCANLFADSQSSESSANRFRSRIECFIA